MSDEEVVLRFCCFKTLENIKIKLARLNKSKNRNTRLRAGIKGSKLSSKIRKYCNTLAQQSQTGKVFI